jgi:radical SAM protein with 4Fe4S-binding SPASM domain
VLEVFRRVGFLPRACGWELTLRCNLRCKHCGSLAGRARADELSCEECLRVADELVEMSCERVTLTGGEPTLHPAWDELAGRLVKGKVQVGIISNAWAWTREHAERAARAGLYSVGFSLDGLEREHDAFRAPGSFARVLDAIRVTREVGLDVAINTTIYRGNYKQLLDMQSLLRKLGAHSWQLQIAIPTGAMSNHRELALPPEDLLWLVPQIAEFCRDGSGGLRVVASDHIGYFGKPEAHLRQPDVTMPFWLGCWAGLHALGIESGGNVKGCLSLPSALHGEAGYIEGNVRQSSLREIWNRSPGFLYTRGFRASDLKGFCRVCRYSDLCRGGCTWKRFSHGDLEAGDTYCFYYQAMQQGRYDLLEDEPTVEEKAYFSVGVPHR